MNQDGISGVATNAKVGIELTEYDKINIETAMKTMELPVPLAEIIAKLYNAIQLLTPPPVELSEPKEPEGYTTFVRANEKGFFSRHKWQKNIATGLWNSDDGDQNVRWSDLEYPTVIGGEK